MAALEIRKRVENCILYTNGSMRLDDVRLSYPHLDEKWSKVDPKTGKKPPEKYSGTFLLDKDTHGEAFELIEERIKEILKERKVRVGPDDWFLRDGDRTVKEGYENHWTVSASEQREVTIRDKKGNKMRDERGQLAVETSDIRDTFYAGCRVSVMLNPWVQDNEYGKKVNANLIAVRFIGDGDRLGGDAMTDDGAWDDVNDAAPASRHAAPARKATTLDDDDEEM